MLLETGSAPGVHWHISTVSVIVREQHRLCFLFLSGCMSTVICCFPSLRVQPLFSLLQPEDGMVCIQSPLHTTDQGCHTINSPAVLVNVCVSLQINSCSPGGNTTEQARSLSGRKMWKCIWSNMPVRNWPMTVIKPETGFPCLGRDVQWMCRLSAKTLFWQISLAAGSRRQLFVFARRAAEQQHQTQFSADSL